MTLTIAVFLLEVVIDIMQILDLVRRLDDCVHFKIVATLKGEKNVTWFS